jgi:hypothetical protein
VLRAISGSLGRNNLGLRAHEAPQKQSVLIVNGINFVGAEITRFFDGWLLNAIFVIHKR